MPQALGRGGARGGEIQDEVGVVRGEAGERGRALG